MQVPWVLLPDLPQREAAWAKHSSALLGGSTLLTLSGGAEVTLTHRPLSLEARLEGQPVLRFNSEGLLNYEHRREKQARRPACTVQEVYMEGGKMSWAVELWRSSARVG